MHGEKRMNEAVKITITKRFSFAEAQLPSGNDTVLSAFLQKLRYASSFCSAVTEQEPGAPHLRWVTVSLVTTSCRIW